jgi:hypothetical protein
VTTRTRPRGLARSRTPRAVRPASEHPQHPERVAPARLLDPGLCLTLRPMAYPAFFEMYRDAMKNTWTVEEVDFSTDLATSRKMSRPSGTSSSAWWRSSPPATPSSPTTWC